MTQAIQTCFHGPTSTKGARITASCEGGKITIPVDSRKGAAEAHRAAAEALARDLHWEGRLIAGALPGGRGYAFVFGDDDIPALPEPLREAIDAALNDLDEGATYSQRPAYRESCRKTATALRVAFNEAGGFKIKDEEVR